MGAAQGMVAMMPESVALLITVLGVGGLVFGLRRLGLLPWA